MKYYPNQIKEGFSLVELIVVIAIIGLLVSVLYASFDESRKQARDKARMTSLKELQLSIETYRAQYGRYPSRGDCNLPPNQNNPVTGVNFTGPNHTSNMDTSSGFLGCAATRPFIKDLTPSFIGRLPKDRFDDQPNRGFYYRTDDNGTAYKLMLHDVVETLTVSSFDHDFARCPRQGGACNAATPPGTTYAVYSPGAEDW